MTTETTTKDEGQQTKDTKVDGDAVRNRFMGVTSSKPVVPTTDAQTQGAGRKTPDVAPPMETKDEGRRTKAVSSPRVVKTPAGGRKPNKPYRQVTTLSPEMHDWLEALAKSLDERIPRGEDGRPVAMNDVIRELLDELRADPTGKKRMEQRIRAKRATGDQ